MNKQISAGLMMFTRINRVLKIFLVHPGGPFFANRDEGWWGIPKGLPEEGEELFAAALREFEEETGIIPPPTDDKSTGDGADTKFNDFISLGSVMQKGGKTVHAWAFEYYDDSPVQLVCNNFYIEWPPKSGKQQAFPECDKGEFFPFEAAEIKINDAQKEFLYRLKAHLKNL